MLDVVLVHGYPLDARSWDDQRAAVRLHAPDLPGFGASDAPACETIDDMARAILRYVEAHVLQRFVLGGLSMGGYVAFACWRLFPASRRPAALVLADTRAEGDSAEAKAGRDVALEVVAREGAGAIADRLVPKVLAPNASGPLRERVRAIMASQRPATIAAALRAMRDRPDATPLLATIDVPTLVLGGELDAVTPPSVMEPMAARIAGARWERLGGVGHLANLEAPEAFSAALARFVGSL